MADPIVFEPLTTDTTGTGSASLPRLRSLGTQTAANYGSATLPRLRSIGAGTYDDYSAAETLAPQWGYGLASLPAFASSGSGTYARTESGSGSASLPRLSGFGMEAPGGYGIASLPALRSAGTENMPSLENFAFLQPSAGTMYAVASDVLTVFDVLTVADETRADIIMALLSRFVGADSIGTLGTLLMTLRSSMAARDAFTVILEAAIADGFDFTDLNSSTFVVILAMADELAFADSQVNTQMAVTTIVSALMVADRFGGSLGQLVEDSFDFTDEFAAMQIALARIVDEIMLADAVVGGMVASLTLSDSFSVDPALEGSMTLLMQLLDSMSVAIRFTTPDGVQYAGYTVNIKNAAVSELSNFGFNSMTNVDGRVIMCGDDGLYLLGGSTDAGANIDARVRLGLTDFGTSALKRVPNAVLGYTSDGRLMMKVITTDGGAKKENHYALRARAADSPVEGRLDFAKGLVSRYWGWELVNVDGADFELDSLKVWPMVLTRRKSGR